MCGGVTGFHIPLESRQNEMRLPGNVRETLKRYLTEGLGRWIRVRRDWLLFLASTWSHNCLQTDMAGKTPIRRK